jgi:hypothetical protein
MGSSSSTEESLSEVMLLMFNSDTESSDNDFDMNTDADSDDGGMACDFEGLGDEPDFDELFVAEEPVIQESVSTFSDSIKDLETGTKLDCKTVLKAIFTLIIYLLCNYTILICTVIYQRNFKYGV